MTILPFGKNRLKFSAAVHASSNKCRNHIFCSCHQEVNKYQCLVSDQWFLCFWSWRTALGIVWRWTNNNKRLELYRAFHWPTLLYIVPISHPHDNHTLVVVSYECSHSCPGGNKSVPNGPSDHQPTTAQMNTVKLRLMAKLYGCWKVIFKHR